MVCLRLIATLVLLACAFPVAALARPLSVLLSDLSTGDRAAQQQAIVDIGQSDEPRALPVLQALSDGKLRLLADGTVAIESEAGALLVADTGAPLAATKSEKIALTNTLRRALSTGLAHQQLRGKDRETRLAAAEVLSQTVSGELVPAVRAALEKEQDGQIRALLSLGLAQADLMTGDQAQRLAAIEVMSESGDMAFLPKLAAIADKNADGQFLEADEKVRKAAASAVSSLEFRKLFARIVRDVFYGASLGSVLLLAALGLAITFGLMGVINMAHGEMIMLGAYSTYVVQQAFVKYAPEAIDWYLPASLPVAFIVCMAVGIVIERSVIRFLYGRPLETLLATFGISLLLIQTVRLTFGASNVAVANPSYLSGGFELLPGLVLPYARLAILVFVVFVVAFVWYLLNRTALGLQVRAITQNRSMAAGVGVRTGRIDMLTFGLGSAVAGLGGVALSQIGNVGPELGQGYIVDSFMVVVVGGVGKLVGTVVTSLGLGMVNKVLEPVAGAVLGKILVLGFVILFIQRRPQGLFALKGRSAEG